LPSGRAAAARAAAILILSAALAPALGGCGKRACIQWTELEGECPSQDEAMEFFEGPECSSRYIQSIDSEPDFDGELCCYDATTQDEEDFPPCAGVPEPGTSSVSGGSGGGSPMPACFNCARVLGEGLFPECPSSLPVIDALLNCTCSGACSAVCGADGCNIPLVGTMECQSCIVDPDMGCGVEFQACLDDPGV
jgi:hypothetical protein